MLTKKDNELLNELLLFLPMSFQTISSVDYAIMQNRCAIREPLLQIEVNCHTETILKKFSIIGAVQVIQLHTIHYLKFLNQWKLQFILTLETIYV